MFIAVSRRRSPSTVYSRSIVSRIRITSSSVSSLTRRSDGTPTVPQISRDLVRPMPCM